eukprot:TRINITY_DN4334_c0_g1_i3.p1 TRINITY_DN4334_c0_g1~~TRINITY_DN4334_c0_g1_i3.p1  ORF type:complete len:308 (+),score=54.70 TRINITY_DN4334_c0_g1_i3:239-1162(+)
MDFIRLLCKYFFHYHPQATYKELYDFSSTVDKAIKSSLTTSTNSTFLVKDAEDKPSSTSQESGISIPKSPSHTLLESLQENKALIVETAKCMYEDEIALLESVDSAESLSPSSFVGKSTPSLSSHSTLGDLQTSAAEESPVLFQSSLTPTVADFENDPINIASDNWQPSSGVPVIELISACDLVAIESTRVILMVKNEDAMADYIAQLALLKDFVLQRATMVRVQTCLHQCARPGGPLYPTRRIRSHARDISDSLFPMGRYLRKLVRVLFAIWHPYYAVSSLAYWTQFRTREIIGGIFNLFRRPHRD